MAGQAHKGRPHLFAAGIAAGLTLAILFAGRAIAIQCERSSVRALAPEVFPLKNQGLAFQRAAAQARDVLPLYGSSEVGYPRDVRGGDFFRSAPTGFQVSPAGKAGASPLILLQKIGALDRDLRDKKVAVSISSSWFWGDPNPYLYEGNFSRFAASHLIFDSRLDLALKHDIAARLVEYPGTLESTPLLDFAVRRLASGSRLDYLVLRAVWPLGKLQDTIWDLQDHFAALAMLRTQAQPVPQQRQTLDWPSLIATAERAAASDPRKRPDLLRHRDELNRDAWFHEHLSSSKAWTDVELLLRVLQQIRARPLLLSMPMNGPYCNGLNISRAARQEFYDRLERLAQRYDFELVDFQEHDEDPNFLNPHLTAKGWIFFNRVIDDFMHDRLPKT
jgi:D-alanine transfer protein